MQAEELVVGLRGEELETGHRQLRADEERHDPAEQEEPERRDHVHGADLLVIGGGHPLVDAGPGIGANLGQGLCCHQRSYGPTVSVPVMVVGWMAQKNV